MKGIYPRRIALPQNGAIALQKFDYKVQEIFESSKKQFEIAKWLDENFDFGFTYTFDYGTIFVENYGIKLLKPDFDFHSTLENPIKNKRDLESLKEIDFRKDGTCPAYLDAIKKVKSISDKPQFCAIVGPFTLAAELCGVIDIAKKTIRDPEFVSELLEFCTKQVLEFCELALEDGVDLIQISEPTAVILSPKAFDKFIKPKLKRITEEINTDMILHICGDTQGIFHHMLECGFKGISVDQIMDISELARKVPSEVVLIGNIDPIEIMANGDVDTVRKRTLEMLDSMREFENYLPSFGCDLQRDMPLENLRAFLDIVNNYGGVIYE